MIKMLQLLCCNFVMIKIADKPWQIIGLRSATLLRKRLWHSCFPVNFAKFIRTPFFIEQYCGCFWKVLLSIALFRVKRKMKIKVSPFSFLMSTFVSLNELKIWHIEIYGKLEAKYSFIYLINFTTDERILIFCQTITNGVCCCEALWPFSVVSI